MIRVFYNKKQTAEKNSGFSPSAGKPKLAVKSWKKLRADGKVKFTMTSNFKPLTVQEIAIAHDIDHVRQILECKKPNGFGNTLKEVASSLRWTTSSLYHASLYALCTGNTAVSPTSGFHHASYDRASGFCTFNGLMITAMLLKKKNLINKIGIVDCDAHYGDGTESIIQKFKLHYVKHYTFGEHNINKDNAEEWLKVDLPSALENMKDCDLIIYQAGADPHENDPLGGKLSSKHMSQRDKIVFKFAKKNNIAIVFNLAGGYQNPIRKVLDIHDQTMIECSKLQRG